MNGARHLSAWLIHFWTPHLTFPKMVVIEGETSLSQPCDREAFDLEKCLFREQYHFTACLEHTQALEKCCHRYKVSSIVFDHHPIRQAKECWCRGAPS